MIITNPVEFEAETEFLESILKNDNLTAHGLQFVSDGDDLLSSIHISFITSWEYETSGEDIVISRKIFIPHDDFLSERTNTTLQECIGGSEKLIQIKDLNPPFAALRVDGLAADDEGYPLIKVTCVLIKTDDDTKNAKQLSEKTALIKKTIKESAKPLYESNPELLWITAGGDTMLERGATEVLFDEGPSGIFGKTALMLKSSDLALINLEGVVSSLGQKVPKSYNFRFIPEVADALKNTGIDAVLHANNHVFDYGEEAFLDSLKNLKNAGIGVVGAGVDDEEASEPFVFTKGDQICRVFGIASFPRERNGWDGENAAAGSGRAGMLHARRGGVEKLKQKLLPDPLDIILFHGGAEWSTEPDASTRRLYTDLIASGADLVIGTHPHEVQGFEWVQGKPVFWSLGNYIFGGMNGFFTGDEGLFIRLGFYHGKLLYIEPFPLFLNDIRTDIVTQDKLKTFYERSRKLRNR